jgi:hypothetical protein
MEKRRNKPERWQEPNGTRHTKPDYRPRVYVEGVTFHMGEQYAAYRIERRVRRHAFIDFERRAQLLAQRKLVIGNARETVKLGRAQTEEKAANREGHGEHCKGRFDGRCRSTYGRQPSPCTQMQKRWGGL